MFSVAQLVCVGSLLLASTLLMTTAQSDRLPGRYSAAAAALNHTFSATSTELTVISSEENVTTEQPVSSTDGAVDTTQTATTEQQQTTTSTEAAVTMSDEDVEMMKAKHNKMMGVYSGMNETMTNMMLMNTYKNQSKMAEHAEKSRMVMSMDYSNVTMVTPMGHKNLDDMNMSVELMARKIPAARCNPYPMIVELPTEPTVTLNPPCILLHRCSGCKEDCFPGEQCAPTHSEDVLVEVAKSYYDTQMDMAWVQDQMDILKVTNHTSCGCQCTKQPGDCNVRQEFNSNDCSCKCKEKLNCDQGKRFNTEKCLCECNRREFECPERAILNKATCQCVHVDNQ